MNKEILDENLIGYLLEALDDETRVSVASQLQADSNVRWRLEQFRRALEPLASDRDKSGPPEGLAIRTLGRVAEYCCLDLPHAPPTILRPAPHRAWWRRADLLVAASLLVVAVGLGLPALFHLRNRQIGPAMVECQNNLRVFNGALQGYHDLHGQFPSVIVERPRHAAGMVVPILAQAGLLSEQANVRCPGDGAGAPCSLTLAQAHALPPDELFRQAHKLTPSYAYSLGHRDEQGGYHGPILPEGEAASSLPLLADNPPADDGPGNSKNHGGAGQYVLFADGHVRFVTVRTVGLKMDDIYLNWAGKVAAGLDPFDTVLGRSAAKP